MGFFHAVFVMSVLLAASNCEAQFTLREIPANTILPNPLPSATLSQWQTATDRTALSLELGGVTLRGFRYAGKDPAAPTILFFNGNGMTIARSDLLYRDIASLGPTVVVYDYRGYGFSTGKADVATFRADGLALFDETLRTSPHHKVIAYGYSMGTAIATYLSTQRVLTALILAAPIASAEEEFPVFARAMGYPAAIVNQLSPAADAKEIFAEALLVAKSRMPLLVLHGNDDHLVPISQGRKIFAASSAGVKKFVELRGVDHKTTAIAPDSLTAVAVFVSKL